LFPHKGYHPPAAFHRFPTSFTICTRKTRTFFSPCTVITFIFAIFPSTMREIYREEKCIAGCGQFSVIIGWYLTIDRAPVCLLAPRLCSFSLWILWKSRHCSAFSQRRIFLSERITRAKEQKVKLLWRVVAKMISKKRLITSKNTNKSYVNIEYNYFLLRSVE